ncbi:helix-turn-helix domain-containing protein [Orenia marismortui]|uniref:helix-turn-helix domain-containing protein n=1 Tax=Orenia marismortui TaxID=46469 RepID=UPI00036593B0|nr:helix-turn-helix domain-containing protein [Orenia marismortui]
MAKNYTKDFKLKVVKIYLKGKMGYRTIKRRFDIGSTSTIRNWVKNYRLNGEKGLENKMRTRKNKSKKDSSEEEILRLKAENDYLKKLLNIESRDIPKL